MARRRPGDRLMRVDEVEDGSRPRFDRAAHMQPHSDEGLGIGSGGRDDSSRVSGWVTAFRTDPGPVTHATNSTYVGRVWPSSRGLITTIPQETKSQVGMAAMIDLQRMRMAVAKEELRRRHSGMADESRSAVRNRIMRIEVPPWSIIARPSVCRSIGPAPKTWRRGSR